MAEDNLKKILGGVTKITPFKQINTPKYNYGGESSLTAGTWDVSKMMDPLLDQFNKKVDDSSKGKCPKGYVLKDGKCVLDKKNKKDDPPGNECDCNQTYYEGDECFEYCKEDDGCDCENNTYTEGDPCYEECGGKTDDDECDCEKWKADPDSLECMFFNMDGTECDEGFDGDCDCDKVLLEGDSDGSGCYDECLEECPNGGSYYNPKTEDFGDGRSTCEDSTDGGRHECKCGVLVMNPDECEEACKKSQPPNPPNVNPNNTDGQQDGKVGQGDLLGTEGNPYSNASDMLNSEQFKNTAVGDPLNIDYSGPSSQRYQHFQFNNGNKENITWTGGTIIKTENGFGEQGSKIVSLRNGDEVTLNQLTEWIEQPGSGNMIRVNYTQERWGNKNGVDINNIKRDNTYFKKNGELKKKFKNQKTKSGKPLYEVQQHGDRLYLIKNKEERKNSIEKKDVEKTRVQQEEETKAMEPLIQLYQKYENAENFVQSFLDGGEGDGCIDVPKKSKGYYALEDDKLCIADIMSKGDGGHNYGTNIDDYPPNKKSLYYNDRKRAINEIKKIFGSLSNYQRNTKSKSNYIPNLSDLSGGNSALQQREQNPVTPEDPLVIGIPYSDAYLRSRGIDPEIYKQLVLEQPKKDKETPTKFKSPFYQGTPETKPVTRKQWTPSHIQSSPMLQQEQPVDGGMLPEVNVEGNQPVDGGTLPEVEVNPEKELWDLWSKTNEEIDKRLYNFNFEKWVPGDKAKKLFSGKTIKNFTNFLEKIKEIKVKAVKDNDKETQAKADSSFQNFIQQATVDIPAKYQMWAQGMGGNEDPSNLGGPTISAGNHKINAMRDNLFFMSSELSDEISPNVDVMNDGSIAIKLGNSPAVRISELGTTFSVDYVAKKQFLDFLAAAEQDAISGKDLNENKNAGIVKQIFNNINTALSGMFDNFYGESLFDALPLEAKNEEWMHPESKDFDPERVTQEVIGYYTHKLNEAHIKNQPPKEELVQNVSSMSASEIINKLS